MATISAPPDSKTARGKIWYAATGCFLAILGLFGLDALLFRTRMYPQLLEPGSSTGLFELILHREQKAQKKLGENLVVTFGNSRFAWSPKIVDRERAASPYRFRDCGIAGSDPRDWYFLARELDPTAHRYRALIFG